MGHSDFDDFSLDPTPASSTDTMSNFCIDVPGGPTCADAKTQCDAACTQTCACVDKCGTDCDEFESNCQALDIPFIANVFCPTQGGFCDVSCIGLCPQRTMMTLMQDMATQIGTNLQGMVALILGQLAPTA